SKSSVVPFMMSQRGCSPSSRIKGIKRFRISATPPPSAVVLTICTVRPASRAASVRKPSISGAPSNGIYSSSVIVRGGGGWVTFSMDGAAASVAPLPFACLTVCVSLVVRLIALAPDRQIELVLCEHSHLCLCRCRCHSFFSPDLPNQVLS